MRYQEGPPTGSRRWFLRSAVALSTGAVALVAAACGAAPASAPTTQAGSAGAKSSSADGTSAAATQPATASASASAAQPAAGKTSLVWLICDYSVGTEGWYSKTFIPAYQQGHAGSDISMIYVPWAQLAQKRDTMYAGGSAPDLVQSGAVMVVEYALKNMVRPADSWLHQWKDTSDYYQSSLDAATYNGKVYGVPARVDARAMIYREDLFKQKGVALPATWDDLKQATAVLTERQGSDVTRLGYSITFTNQQFFPVLWQNGGEVLSADGRQPAFNAAEGVDALTYWVELLNSVAPQGTQLASTGPQVPLIAAGRIASEMGADGELFNVVQFAPDMAANLAVKPPLMRKQQTINVFNNWFGVSAPTKQPDQAWDLLAAFNEPATLLAYNKTVTSLPPRKSLANDPFVADPKYHLSSFVEVVNKYAKPQPKVPNYAECWKTMDDGLEAALRGQQSPKDALNGVAQKWTQLLSEGYGGKS